ncbi:Hypothetical protein MVR_LOCUS263 [uncultured virus]|nr:Hypothetical protein MVR_LOCUS263 [uncultured virus]
MSTTAIANTAKSNTNHVNSNTANINHVNSKHDQSDSEDDDQVNISSDEDTTQDQSDSEDEDPSLSKLPKEVQMIHSKIVQNIKIWNAVSDKIEATEQELKIMKLKRSDLSEIIVRHVDLFNSKAPTPMNTFYIKSRTNVEAIKITLKKPKSTTKPKAPQKHVTLNEAQINTIMTKYKVPTDEFKKKPKSTAATKSSKPKKPVSPDVLAAHLQAKEQNKKISKSGQLLNRKTVKGSATINI